MRAVMVFVVVATVGFGVYGVAQGSPAVSYYVPITLLLVAVFALIDRSVHFSAATRWALAAAAVGNLAGGLLLIGGEPLYELVVVGDLRFDKLYHAGATGVGAWASFEAIQHWVGVRRPALIGVAILMAGGGGALVEIVEYAGTLIRDNTVVGGYTNNMQDLVANMVGATVGATLAFRRFGRVGSSSSVVEVPGNDR